MEHFVPTESMVGNAHNSYNAFFFFFKGLLHQIWISSYSAPISSKLDGDEVLSNMTIVISRSKI